MEDLRFQPLGRDVVIHASLFKNELVGEDNEYSVSRISAAWVALLASSPVDTKPASVVNRFARRLIADYQKVVATYAVLGDDFLAAIHADEAKSPPESMPHAGMHALHFTDLLYRRFAGTPIFREYHYFMKTWDPACAKYIMSVLWFAKKADFNSEAFFVKAEERWKATEQRLGELEWADKRTSALAEIMDTLLIQPDGPMLFRHGPGSVAERGITTLTQKQEELRYHPLFDTILYRESGTIYADLALPAALRGLVGSDPRISDDVARILFVRKNYKTARTVCMEPTSFMYMQQGLLSLLRRCMVAPRSFLRRYVNIDDQGRNQSMALNGSGSGGLATLDVSDASDSVSWDLVSRVFSPEWTELLQSCRTDQVYLPRGGIMRVKKFAPMGSAVCFPIQCLIFTAICVLANSLYRSGVTFEQFSDPDSWEMRHLYRVHFPRSEELCVYGDDIVIADYLVSLMMDLLPYFGFVLNVSKSFYGSQAVRESCGIYALNGDDITPLIFKVGELPLLEHSDDPSPEQKGKAVAVEYGLIAMANMAYAEGYDRLRSYLLQMVHPGHFVFLPSQGGYANCPWVAIGDEGWHASRKLSYDEELQRYVLPIWRFALSNDPTLRTTTDEHGNVRLTGETITRVMATGEVKVQTVQVEDLSALETLYDSDSTYWRAYGMANSYTTDRDRFKSIGVKFAPLKALYTRGNLRLVLTPVA